LSVELLSLAAELLSLAVELLSLSAELLSLSVELLSLSIGLLRRGSIFAAVYRQLVVSTTYSYNVTILVLSRIYRPRYRLKSLQSSILSIVLYNLIIDIIILVYC
jgi:hypothetical protein